MSDTQEALSKYQLQLFSTFICVIGGNLSHPLDHELQEQMLCYVHFFFFHFIPTAYSVSRSQYEFSQYWSNECMNQSQHLWNQLDKLFQKFLLSTSPQCLMGPDASRTDLSLTLHLSALQSGYKLSSIHTQTDAHQSPPKDASKSFLCFNSFIKMSN